MLRTGYFLMGWTALLLGAIGVVLPLLPTVPFVILAAFCFARSDARLERWLIGHPRFGPHITAWRSRGAISRRGKSAAMLAFGLSALVGVFALGFPWALVPIGAALLGGSWILTRPEA